MTKHYSLLEINRLVREAIGNNLRSQYWLETEIAQISENRGHCYLELIQKEQGYNTPVARAQAKCWRNVWGAIKPYFEHATGQTLSAGMKILVCVRPDFHEAYGFSWIIDDIDPRFTLGDMARRRQEIIRQLKEEGVFDLNRELQLPMFTQRIAVISSSTAAGYGDFCRQLADNAHGLHFSTTLFNAIMQGEGVEESIIAALNKINADIDRFDCVVIIRGGGATSDMAGFDSLPLAENVANFPLPIITGIGHDRDECVLDMVSHTRMKTPTAAAAFLIDHLNGTADRINDASERITAYIQRRIENEKMRLSHAAERIPLLFSLAKSKHENELKALSQRIPQALELITLNRRHRLDLLSQRVSSLDPALLLRRGYSITLLNGHTLRSQSEIKPGDTITTRLADGFITSVATDSQKHEKKSQDK